MRRRGVIFFIGIVLITILIVFWNTLWNVLHPFENCDSFAGGVRSGWRSYVDGYSSGTLITFIDTNENQILDAGESPLPFVSGEGDFDFFVTNKEGKFTTYQFKPGCCNGCWHGSYITVNVPTGYRPTTPLNHEFTGNDVYYYSGFIQIKPIDYPKNIDKYPWITGFINNGLVISSFTYNSCCSLTLEIDPKDTTNDIDLQNYDEMRNFLKKYIFEVIDSLNDEVIYVNQIQIKLISTGETFTCVYNTDYKWATLSAGDYVSNKYCEVPKY
jgi:hypothetical protein